MNRLQPEPQSLYPTMLSITVCRDYLTTQLPITTANDLNTALMTYHNTLLKQIKESDSQPKTVSELAEAKYPGRTYDTALPIQWVKQMQERGFDPVGNFVALYPKPEDQMLGFYMAPITPEGEEMAARVATMEA